MESLKRNRDKAESEIIENKSEDGNHAVAEGKVKMEDTSEGEKLRRSSKAKKSKKSKESKRKKKKRKKKKKERKKSRKKAKKRRRLDTDDDETSDSLSDSSGSSRSQRSTTSGDSSKSASTARKSDSSSWYASILEQEKAKPMVGTTHAVNEGKKYIRNYTTGDAMDAGTVDAANEHKKLWWKCSSCGKENYKKSDQCESCNAMKRLG